MRKKRSPFLSVEGRKPDDVHIRLTQSMGTSEAFKALPGNAIKLYLAMKAAAGKNLRGEFTFTVKNAGECGLKPDSFHSSRDNLIKFGFVEYINPHNGRYKREAARFVLSDKWQAFY